MVARALPWVCAFLCVLGLASGQDDHPNQPTGAKPLTAAGLSGRIETPGDRDVFRLDATAGTRYRVETSDLAGGCDTYLYLYDPQGRYLQSDDDGAGNLASRIVFDASETAAYWVLVRHYDRTSGTGGYRVRAAIEGAPTTPTTPTGPTTTPTGPTTPTAPTAPTTPTTPTTGAATLRAGLVFDPRLAGGSLAIDSTLQAAGAARLEVRDAAGALVREVASGSWAAGTRREAWDGRDAQGLFVAPGSYTLRLSLGGAPAASATVSVVRLGIRSIAFEGAGRVALTWHGAGAGRFPVDRAGPAWAIERSPLSDGCLDARDGTPLGTPAVVTDTNRPPRASDGSVLARGRSLPVAYVLGSAPQARVQLGDRAATGNAAVACNYPVAGHPIRVVVDGGQAVQSMSGEVLPGGESVLDLPALPQTLGKHTLRYRFRFLYQDGSTWQAIPGALESEHVLYTLVAAPGTDLLPQGSPWVAALDRVSGWVAGERDAAGALAKVVAAVNGSQGLRYDVVMGAPAYADGYDLEAPVLDLDAYIDGFQKGRVVNCWDCASIVNKLAAQVGARTRIAILGWNFSLHWLEGIGGSGFIHDLFGGYHEFSYHAVATVDAGASVHDACLRVDDDARPDASPFRERLPVAMPFGDYRRQLSPDSFSVQSLGQASLR
ncbi:MAG: FlgD immunoglobulin-like domain containing protein [Planctomycetota bacterium]